MAGVMNQHDVRHYCGWPVAAMPTIFPTSRVIEPAGVKFNFTFKLYFLLKASPKRCAPSEIHQCRRGIELDDTLFFRAGNGVVEVAP